MRAVAFLFLLLSLVYVSGGNDSAAVLWFVIAVILYAGSVIQRVIDGR